MERAHRQEHQERDQRRYRRLLPGTRDGLRRAPHFYRPHDEVPFCGERRRRRLCRSHSRPRSRRNAIHSLLEDVHNAGDHDQRRDRAPVDRECAQERCCRSEALRGSLDERAGSQQIWNRHRQHVRILGLGRRTLFDGLRHRTFHHDRDRTEGSSKSYSPDFTTWTSTSGQRRWRRIFRS